MKKRNPVGKRKAGCCPNLTHNPPNKHKIEAMAKKRRSEKYGVMAKSVVSKGEQTMLFANWAKTKAQSIPIVDLFCCIGGFSTGATQAGHSVILGVDSDDVALASHAANHPTCRHECMKLGPETEEQLVEILKQVLPSSSDGGFAPWHLHGSPPCQKFSSMPICTGNISKEDRTKRIEEGMKMVVWYTAFVERCRRELGLVGWTFEEVAHGELLNELAEIRSPGSGSKDNVFNVARKYGNRSRTSWFDFEVFHMQEFGVPQTRNRVIGGSPWLINRMRHSKRLRVDRPVTIRETIPDIPQNAKYLRQSWSRDWNSELSTTTSDGEFVNADAERLCRLLDEPAFTVTRIPFCWWDENYGDMERMSLEHMKLLQTFPRDYVVPPLAKDATLGIGNAIPPIFAYKLMSDYAIPPTEKNNGI